MPACIAEEHLVMSVLEFHMVLEFVVDRGREITKITLTNKPRARRQLFSSASSADALHRRFGGRAFRRQTSGVLSGMGLVRSGITITAIIVVGHEIIHGWTAGARVERLKLLMMLM